MNNELAAPSDLIINLRTSSQPLIQLRDLVLRIVCWSLWGLVLLAIVNGCDGAGLSLSAHQLLTAQAGFFTTLLAALHVSQLYVFLTLILIASFMLWSLLQQIRAPWSRKRTHLAVWNMEAIARHFHVDPAQLDVMQKERQVLVFHALSGAVTELRSLRGLRGLRQQQLLRA